MASVAKKHIDAVEDQVEDMPQAEAPQDDVAHQHDAEPADVTAGQAEAVQADEAEAQDDTAQQAEPVMLAEAAAQADEAPQVAARPEELRILEALLFASTEPLDQSALAKRMPEGVNVKKALEALQADYAMRGINLVRIANKWTFRTAGDLAWLMTRETSETKKLSRAAVEVLAIVAYHQPVTRAEIEDIRGVVTSKGTLDVLLETGWIKPRGRRKTPGRPLTFGTTDTFLSQFGLEALGDLPGLEELKGTGLLDSRLPAGFSVPNPSDDPQLREDEDPLEDGELHLSLSEPDPEFPEAQGEQGEAAAADEAKAEVIGLAEVADTDADDAGEVADLTDAPEAEAPALGVVEIDEDEAEDAEDAAEAEQDEAETAELDADEADEDDFDDEDDDFEDDEDKEIDADGAEEGSSADGEPKSDEDEDQHR